MRIYIRATANISPQKTFGPSIKTSGLQSGWPSSLEEPVEYMGTRLTCIEPDYKDLIDAKLIRRMSRIMKMGVAAASSCLREAGGVSPDAIITGTAFGCLEDTGLFLTRVIEQHEEALSPTAFIQSTHNTVGGQIALIHRCHCYNNTFVHRGFSFESALLDSLLLLREKEAATVLAGSVEEITDISHAIQTRFGLYKRYPGANLDLFTTISKGTIAGEGAAFFLLANSPSVGDYACVDAMTTFYKPHDIKETEDRIASFLTDHSMSIGDVDLVITGNNGDPQNDNIYELLKQAIFSNCDRVYYKNLCGEYPTSASFALWLAAHIIKAGSVPAAVYRDRKHGRLDNEENEKGQVTAGRDNEKKGSIKRILIYNHYQNIHHSLLLISAC